MFKQLAAETRRIQQRRAAQRRAQRKARGTLLTALRPVSQRGRAWVEFVRDSWLTFGIIYFDYLRFVAVDSESKNFLSQKTNVFIHLVKPKPTSPRAVSFCQGIDSILNFRAAKAAKARPVTIGLQRLCHCQILKDLKLDSSKEVSNCSTVFSSFPIERWRICFCLFWVRNIGQLNQELALTPKERAMQKYAHTPRCSKLVFLDSTCTPWMQNSCISYGGEDHPPQHKDFCGLWTMYRDPVTVTRKMPTVIACHRRTVLVDKGTSQHPKCGFDMFWSPLFSSCFPLFSGLLCTI